MISPMLRAQAASHSAQLWYHVDPGRVQLPVAIPESPLPMASRRL